MARNEAVPLPAPEPDEPFDLYGLFLDYYNSDIADPKAMARAAYYDIPESQRARLAQAMLAERFREWTRSARNHLRSSNTSGKWRNVAEANASGALEIFRARVAVGPRAGDWRLLGDCTAEDCEAIAEYNQALAEANAAQARRYRKLALQIRTEGAKHVGELDAVLVRKILSE